MQRNMPAPIPPTGPQVKYRVNYQQEKIGTGPDGKLTDGVEVGFTTDQGVTGTVFLAKSMYNAVNVQSAIQGYAGQLHEVKRQGGL